MERQSGQYFGQITLNRQIDEYIFALSQHAKQTPIPNHHHINPYFTLVLEGNYQEIVGSSVCTFQKGDLVFHPAGTEHSNQFHQSAACCFNLEVQMGTTSPINGYLFKASTFYCIDRPDLKSLMVRLWEEVQWSDDFSELIVTGLTHELIGRFLRHGQRDQRPPRWVDQIKNFLQEMPQQNPSLEQLSQLTGVSTDQLCRQFSRSQGLTLGQYIRQQKVAQACELLTRTTLSMEEIAFNLGFTDASHFNKVFKKVLNMPPSSFRLKVSSQSYTSGPKLYK